MHLKHQLTQWATFRLRFSGDPGLGAETVLGRMAREGWTSNPNRFASRIPNGVQAPGLREYLEVERVLGDLTHEHRACAEAEYFLPVLEAGRTQQQRADRLGLHVRTYCRRLRDVQDRLQTSHIHRERL